MRLIDDTSLAGNNRSYDICRCLSHSLPLEWLTLADLLV